MTTEKQQAYYDRLRSNPSLLAERGSRGGKTTAARLGGGNLLKRVRCAECEMESNLGAMRRHQRAAVHKGLEDVA
jgi:hypothetical protein